MEKDLQMVKLQNNNKVVLVRRPGTYTDLEALFKERFKLHDLKELALVYYEGEDEISIESDQDLSNAYEYLGIELKIHQKCDRPKVQQSKNLDLTDVACFTEFLESELAQATNEVGEIIENDEIPCKECFFTKYNDDSSFDAEENYECAICNGKGSVAMSKSWKIISLLIDYKIKQYVLDPLRTFQGSMTSDKEAKNLILNHPGGSFDKKESKGQSRENVKTADTNQSFLSRTNCTITPLFRNNVT